MDVVNTVLLKLRPELYQSRYNSIVFCYQCKYRQASNLSMPLRFTYNVQRNLSRCIETVFITRIVFSDCRI